MERLIVDKNSGEVLREVDSDAKIIVKEQSKESKFANIPSRTFVRADRKECKLLFKELNTSEKALLFSVVPYIAYLTCEICYENGQELTIEDIADISGMSYKTAQVALSSLMKKCVIYKGRTGNTVQYFVNPWICNAGARYNAVLETMFRNYKIRSYNGITWKEFNKLSKLTTIN